MLPDLMIEPLTEIRRVAWAGERPDLDALAKHFERYPQAMLVVRRELRSLTRVLNKDLRRLARAAGARRRVDYARVHDAGYVGLYAGMSSGELHRRRELRRGRDALDYMGVRELVANVLRIGLAVREIRGKADADLAAVEAAHRRAGDRVRRMLVQRWGWRPPELAGKALPSASARVSMSAGRPGVN